MQKPKWGYVSTQPGSSLWATLSTNVVGGQLLYNPACVAAARRAAAGTPARGA